MPRQPALLTLLGPLIFTHEIQSFQRSGGYCFPFQRLEVNPGRISWCQDVDSELACMKHLILAVRLWVTVSHLPPSEPNILKGSKNSSHFRVSVRINRSDDSTKLHLEHPFSMAHSGGQKMILGKQRKATLLCIKPRCIQRINKYIVLRFHWSSHKNVRMKSPHTSLTGM